MRYLALITLFVLVSCGSQVKSYKIQVVSEELIAPSFMNLVNTSTAEDLECLKMEFQISGVSEGKEAFSLVTGEGSLDIDSMVADLRSGNTITLSSLVGGWDSPAQIEPNFALTSLKILVNGYYSLCHKGKPINILFYGEESFSEPELASDSLVIPLIVSTLMPVNAVKKNRDQLDQFHRVNKHITYVLLNHKKDKFSTIPHFCSDSKAGGNKPNSISITPHFVKLTEDSKYEITDPMFSSSYSGYFNHDFNFIEKEDDDLSSFPYMMLLPTFTHLPYDIKYQQGTGDGCEDGLSLFTRIRVSSQKREECHDETDKILVCSVDWDLKDDRRQAHRCSCDDLPDLEN